ncbi:hypothetical protein AAT19DRAFT_14927 [Rhodotorula toruloides]|uniref:Uncharacterized protein n=1 Tax=Rhodotorula toruloides TaxID=5286 RepID=A0A2T0A984_RHOTO|nr:hypothetical protein AAT19DRAFT_14927 [Rhodotorula toruloides]
MRRHCGSVEQQAAEGGCCVFLGESEGGSVSSDASALATPACVQHSSSEAFRELGRREADEGSEKSGWPRPSASGSVIAVPERASMKAEACAPSWNPAPAARPSPPKGNRRASSRLERANSDTALAWTAAASTNSPRRLLDASSATRTPRISRRRRSTEHPNFPPPNLVPSCSTRRTASAGSTVAASPVTASVQPQRRRI